VSDETFHSGFVTLIGRPNAGKSSLLNRIIGAKVAITSEKPQTTRRQIQGVLSGDGFQAVFIDTPGIHKPMHRLGENMNRQAMDALNSVDLVLWIIDATKSREPDRMLAERLKQTESMVYAVFNKSDLEQAIKPQAYLEACGVQFPWLSVSALTGEGVERLIEVVREHLPEGPMYYPEGTLTDHPEQFIAAEMVREAVLRYTQEEVPHAIAVVVEEMETRSDGKVYIRAVIYTERESQKGIVIGAKGRLLKNIGSDARVEIEKLLGSSVFLDLWVKSRKDWRNSPTTLRDWNLD
jgi:GTP-binding protein Era